MTKQKCIFRRRRILEASRSSRNFAKDVRGDHRHAAHGQEIDEDVQSGVEEEPD